MQQQGRREKRNKNVVSSGSDFLNKDQVKEWISRKLSVNVTIKNKQKTIRAQLEKIQQKQEIMRYKRKLRTEEDKVCIKNDDWVEVQNR